MGRGGGNGRRRISVGGRGNNSTTQGSNTPVSHQGNDSTPQGSNTPVSHQGNDSTPQGSNNTIAPDHEPLSPHMDGGLENIPANADDYTSESSQHLVQGSNTTRQKGSSTTQHMPARSLHKTFLTPLGTVFDVQGVPGEVREILIGMFDGCWTTWKKVPKESQDLMWERFQSKFQWDPKHETIVKQNWEGILKGRFRDLMRDARKDAIKLATKSGVIVGDDWSVLKPFHLDWIDEANWAAMIDDCWNTESWKRKSAKNKRNRATLVEGKMAGHSGGSRSMIHTQLYMEKERGGPVAFIEVYESYFTKKGSKSCESREFTTPKAGNVWSEYNRLLVEKFGPNSVDHPTQIVPNLWENACGGMKKGNLFGATKDILVMADDSFDNCGSYVSRTAGPSNEEVETLKEEVKRQKREAEETKKQAEIAEREAEELKTKVAELQEREIVRELEMKNLQEREKAREVKMQSLEDQMKVFAMFMQDKMPPSS